MEKIRAALVENLERPRRMYQRFLERIDQIELTPPFHYPEQLLTALDEGLKLDVIVMDIRMDDDLNTRRDNHMDGIEAARAIRKKFPRMPIVLYSMWENPTYYRRVEEARFSTRYAFVKRYSLDDPSRLAEIIGLVMRGQTYIDPEIQVEMDLLKEHNEKSPLHRLENDEQRKVLALLADGLSNDDIAHTLSRSTRWVEEEVKSVYQLLLLSNEGSGDSRRIRATRMFHEDRILIWERNADKQTRILAEDRQGQWRPLDEIKREEGEIKEDARIINNATTL